MDFEELYKEASGYDVGKHNIDNTNYYSEDYVNWLEQQLLIQRVVSSLPTKEEMHLELSNRVEDIKTTSSMGANKQMLLAYRIGFEECDDYMRKR